MVLSFRAPVIAAALFACLGSVPLNTCALEPAEVIRLWPDTVPGESSQIGEERDMTTSKDRPVAGLPVIRLGNVSQPTISIYKPISQKADGPAVIVCPGGGYHILAMDLEGTEVCQWLNSIGVTAVLLKYRVPKRAGLEKHAAAFQDGQRALSIVKSKGRTWGIDTNRVGVLGFSAGGHLAALLSNSGSDRAYKVVDAADRADFQPDFALLIYPAYLTLKEKNDALAPEMTVTSNTPPTFMVMAQDDPIRVETVLFYSAALRKAQVPFELHVYPTGGHGYGLRPNGEDVTTWPHRAADWMRSRGLLESGN